MMNNCQYLYMLMYLLQVTNCQLIYYLREEVEIGHVIGDVRQDANLQDQYSKEVFKKLTFHFLSDPKLPWLGLQQETGVLYTNERVDREVLCGSLKSSQASQPLYRTKKLSTRNIIKIKNKRASNPFIENINPHNTTQTKTYSDLLHTEGSDKSQLNDSGYRQNVALELPLQAEECSVNVDVALSPFEHFTLIR